MSQTTRSLLHYGCGDTPLGEAVAFWTAKGICALRLLGNEKLTSVLEQARRQYPDCDIEEQPSAALGVFQQVDGWLAGKVEPQRLTLDLRGTPFQRRVWQEMLKVPHGQTCSYTELARRVGKPRAVRAVASACARNPLGLLVPCHRIVRQDGSLGGYYWGLEKKKRLLEHERSQAAL